MIHQLKRDFLPAFQVVLAVWVGTRVLVPHRLPVRIVATIHRTPTPRSVPGLMPLLAMGTPAFYHQRWAAWFSTDAQGRCSHQVLAFASTVTQILPLVGKTAGPPASPVTVNSP